MSKLWQDFQTKKQYIIDKNPISPYIEVWDSRPEVVKVNPLVRFAAIFLPLCQKESGLSEAEENEIANKLWHYLARLDRLQGLGTSAFPLLVIQADVEKGKYGTDLAAWYQTLTARQQLPILQGLYQRQHEELPGNDGYRLFLQKFFPGTKVYLYEAEHKVLVYLPYKKTADRVKTAAMVQQLFLDWTFAVRLFWQYPFGLIGRAETMRIGATVVY